MGKAQKKSAAVSRQPRPNVLIICLYGFTAKIQNFFQELQFAIDVFFFLGDSRSGWPLEAAACHVPSVGGGCLFQKHPHASETHAQPPLTKKAGNRFVGAFFPACAHRLVAVVNLPTASPLVAGKRNRETLPLAKFRNPLTPNTKKIFFFFPPPIGGFKKSKIKKKKFFCV